MANDVEIRIGVESDQASAELDKVAKNTGKLKGAADESSSSLNKNNQSLKESAIAAGKAAAGIAAAAGALNALSGFIKDSVSVSADYEERFLAINQAVEATGGAAGLTAIEVRELSQELALATLGSVEGFENAALKLLTFKSVTEDTFTRALELSQDLAQSGFGSLESNAIQLGKALEDPVKGLTALSRSGVTFTDAQKAVIKSLVETGDQAKAQGLILDAISTQVGGVGKAAALGYAGALDTVGQRFEELKVASGNAMTPALTDFYRELDGVLVSLKGNVPAMAVAFSSAANSIDAAFNVMQAGVGTSLSIILKSLGAVYEASAALTFGDLSEKYKNFAAELNGFADELTRGVVEDAQEARDAWEKIGQAPRDAAAEYEAGVNQIASSSEKITPGINTAKDDTAAAFAEIAATPGDYASIYATGVNEFTNAPQAQFEQGLDEFDAAVNAAWAEIGAAPESALDKYRIGANEFGDVTDRAATVIGEAADDIVKSLNKIPEAGSEAEGALKSAFGNLGLDYEQAATGISGQNRKLIDSFGDVATAFGQDAGVMQQAVGNVLKKLSTTQEIEAFKGAITIAMRSGSSATDVLQSALDKANQKLQGTKDAAAGVNNELRDGATAGRNAGNAIADGYKQATEAAKELSGYQKQLLQEQQEIAKWEQQNAARRAQQNATVTRSLTEYAVQLGLSAEQTENLRNNFDQLEYKIAKNIDNLTNKFTFGSNSIKLYEDAIASAYREVANMSSAVEDLEHKL